MIGNRRLRVAAAQYVNPTFQHNGCMTAAWRGQRRRLAPRPRRRVVDAHIVARHVGVGVKATDQINLSVQHDGRGRVETRLRNRPFVTPDVAVEPLEHEDRHAANSRARQRVERPTVANHCMSSSCVVHRRLGTPGFV